MSISRTFTIVLAACIFLGGCGGAAAGEWSPSDCAAQAVRAGDEAQKAASEALRRALAEDRGRGVTAAVMIDGRLVWSEALGYANDRDAITPAARIRIGSVSKGFTAAMLGALVEAGRADPDAVVQTYVPEFPRKAADITLRQLVTHTSGLRHYDFGNYAEANNTVHYARLTDALKLFANDALVSQPGQAVHYSSFGFNLLGVAIERITGTDYGQALHTLVTEPMGLNSVALDDATVTVPCRTAFYTNSFGWLQTATVQRDSSDYYPSGGLVATSEDLARFATAVFGDGSSEAFRALMTQPPVLADGEPGAHAFAWEVHRDAAGDVDWYGLGGAANGAHASVRYYPRLRMAVAGAINYNFFLTERRPAFFRAIREEIPAIYAEAAAG